MTEELFKQNTASITEAIETICVQRGLSPEDTAAIAGASLGQLLTHQLGPFGAINRLRDLADVFERQLIDGMGRAH
jgi:hypothetical protein